MRKPILVIHVKKKKKREVKNIEKGGNEINCLSLQHLLLPFDLLRRGLDKFWFALSI